MKIKTIIHYSVFSIQKLSKKLIIALLALIVIAVPLIYLTVLNSKTASAAWYDDNWAYRKYIMKGENG